MAGEIVFFFFSSRRRHTRFKCDWSSDVCSSDLLVGVASNRNGYGARVEVVGAEPATIRELPGGGSFQAGSPLEPHLGLEREYKAMYTARWPVTTVDTHAGVAAPTWLMTDGRASRRHNKRLSV